MIKRRSFLCFLIVFVLSASPLRAEDYSDTSRFVQGFGKVLAAPFYLPSEIIQKTFSEFPLGVINGTLGGVYRMSSMLVSGIFDMAGAAAPYAKYVFPFFL